MSTEAAFYNAVTANDVGEVSVLLKARPDLMWLPNPFGNSPLHQAADHDATAVAKLLVDNGCPIETRNDYGWTPLFNAVSKEKIESVRCLLELGANVNAKNKWSGTPLTTACIVGNIQIVEELVTHGAWLDVYFGERQWSTLVQEAERKGNAEVVEYLLARGAPRTPPADAGTPLSDLDRMCEHVEKNIGSVERFIARRIDDAMDLHVARAEKPGKPVVVFSSSDTYDIGVDLLPPEGVVSDIRFCEFAIQLPANWPLGKKDLKNPAYRWPLKRAAILSWLPSLEDVWFGETPLIVSNDDPPQPLGKGVAFTCTMLVKDATLPPLQTEYGKVVHFYTLVPLYTEERDFEKKHGLKALLDRFEKAGLDFTIDPNRPNVALNESRN